MTKLLAHQEGRGIAVPTAQSFLNYLLLLIVYVPVLASRGQFMQALVNQKKKNGKEQKKNERGGGGGGKKKKKKRKEGRRGGRRGARERVEERET